ncbi:hypothetical protein RIVM261_026490 [Rivularia sp. IAM M-261]|nr:hypothetical protein CAL7716_014540 [Calothrix sp. PCC 7716]GJD17693.1 hypothetical protein RIVM261_026490 [Rivularia sp. IAM M-261]
MLRQIILSNIVVAGLMLTTFPATASTNVNKTPSSPTSTLLAQAIDQEALYKAGNALERAANAMLATQTAKSIQQVQLHFDTALVAMEETASLLEQAGVPEGAQAMNRALASVQAAVNAESDAEADNFIKEAGKALDDVVAALEKAAN